MPEVLQQMLNYVIAIYIRLSAEDGDLSDEKSESNSVVNQRAYIRRFIELRPEFARAQILEFCDAPDIIGLKQNPTKRASL